ncbi:t-SNARE [Sistotremastrum niveocremeum HHB9708]|uniref:t-SNARE n=2 Tax=Sistotremastraceae TaxID=3402574 RepID=A0A164UY99_9AGAM|nr:t-SNARE [Sistotremastrum niveocremeum HHB9708]KZT34594.1 t-SNARE [Sistotremastrum suecicum HHB10207 ss-3]
MSFADIEAGLPRRTNSTSGVPASPQEATFQALQQSLSLQVFKINANVQGILKLVDQLGTARDTGNVRTALHSLTETTRDMAKRGTEDLKKLAALQTSLPQFKNSSQKTSHDFQLSLVAFQRAQQVSAEKQRNAVDGAKVAVEEEQERGQQDTASSPEERQSLVLQQRLSPAELAHQEMLIQEREVEIREIESGIHELSEIFRDLGTIVGEQGTMIDNIESNISSVAVDTSSAAEELHTAHDYQRKAGKRAACLMIVVAIVICIVLLAVLS